MINLTISVDTGDGARQVQTTVWAWTALERRNKSKASRLAQDGLGVEDIAYLAYESSRGQVTLPAVFDDYLRRIVNLEVIGTDTPGPFDQEQSAGT